MPPTPGTSIHRGDLQEPRDLSRRGDAWEKGKSKLSNCLCLVLLLVSFLYGFGLISEFNGILCRGVIAVFVFIPCFFHLVSFLFPFLFGVLLRCFFFIVLVGF